MRWAMPSAGDESDSSVDGSRNVSDSSCHVCDDYDFKSEGIMKALNSTKLGLWDYNPMTGFLHWNKHMYLLFDKPRVENEYIVTFDDFFMKVHPDDREEVLYKLNRAGVTGRYDAIYRVVWRDGSIYTYQACSENHRNPDGTISMVGTVVDITALTQEQDREAEHAMLQQTLNEEMRHRDEVKRLLRTMSHEVRNPLHGILSTSDLLMSMVAGADKKADGGKTFNPNPNANPNPNGNPNANPNGNPNSYTNGVGATLNGNANGDVNENGSGDCDLDIAEMRTCLDDLLECSMHQIMLCNDLLDYETVKGEKHQLSLINLDLSEMTTRVMQLFNATAKNKGLSLSVNLLSERKVLVTDGQSVKRILMNLVSNALKFTVAGSVTIDLDIGEQWTTITVSDTGPGIPAEFKGKLFTTVGLTTTNSEYICGSGLGLCICNTLVTNLRGTITHRNREPHGTIMEVKLATHADAELGMVVTEPTLPLVPGLASCLHTKRFIAADDSNINRKVLQRMLQGIVAELKLEEDGSQLVANFKKGRYDLVVLDLHMNRVGGKAAATEVRKIDPCIPLVFLTGETSTSVCRELTQMFSPCRILIKPCVAAEFIQVCVSLLYPTGNYMTRILDQDDGEDDERERRCFSSAT